ncbi:MULTISPECIES: hypothetical protein [unclassified Mesorhizobium]|uniref:hypothetical protein n=1 Tax=unclassified Mesorhizobium TaxID=325217 RepID=UPI001FDFBF2C|nr:MULTISPECIES: hypothetical protein [unclassified Mesorhizobium]
MDPKIGKMPQGGLHGSLIRRTRYRCASLRKQHAFDLAFFAVSASLTNSAAADTVNWRQFEGTSITWAYDIHPYADALAAQLPEFEKLTGIKVTPELYPDDSYWNKMTIQLTTKSPAWDVFGTGIQPA